MAIVNMARAALDKRIGQDHYDLPAILERLLLSATVGDFEGAWADAQIFERLGFAAEANRVLSRIAKGDAPVTAVGRVYMVAPPDTVDVEAIGRIVTDACAALADHLGRAIKPVWIDFQDGPPYANVTRLELAGLARISLSRRLFQQSDWSSILWHEAAHRHDVRAEPLSRRGLGGLVSGAVCSGDDVSDARGQDRQLRRGP